MLILALFRLFSIVIPVSCTVSSCPRYGNYGFKCSSYDYCNSTAGLICGTGLCGNECTAGWSLYNGSICYKYVSTAVTQTTAYDACLNLNAQLFTVNTDGRYLLMRQLSTSDSNAAIWTGAYLNDQLSYDWPDGTILTTSSSRWLSSQPSNQVSQLCVRLSWSSSTFGFADIYCSSSSYTYNYVCERRIDKCVNSVCNCKSTHYYYYDGSECVLLKTHSQNCTSSIECDATLGLICSTDTCKCADNYAWGTGATKCRLCPNGWVKINEYCYYYESSGKYYSYAQSNCETLQGKLATFETREEMNGVATYFSTLLRANFTAWIGVSHSDSYYRWDLDSVVVVFSFWCSAPSNNYYYSGVLVTSKKCLDDYSEYSTFDSICEY